MKMRLVLLMILSVLFVSMVQAQEIPIHWPTNGWKSGTPEAQGMDLSQTSGNTVDYPEARY